MWRVPVSGFCLMSFMVAMAASNPEDSTAIEVVKAAIKAQGGRDRLSRLQICRISEKGTRYNEEETASFESILTQKLPQRKKLTVFVRGSDYEFQQSSAYVNGKGWEVATDDSSGVHEVVGKHLKQQEWNVAVSEMLLLYPLLDKEKYRLSCLPDQHLEGNPVKVVKIQSEGHPFILFFFDASSGLLRKFASQGAKDSPEIPLLEQYLDCYKIFDGLKYPTRTRRLVMGKKFFDSELTDIKFLENIDDSEFSPPSATK